MRTRMVLAAVLLVCGSTAALAAQNAGQKTINIGDLEVRGEVRRPMLQFVDSDRQTMESLADMSRTEFEKYERELLVPAQAKGGVK